MPRKTSVDSASEGSQKPKKKIVRKKKAETASMPIQEEIVQIPPEETAPVEPEDNVDNFEVHPSMPQAEPPVEPVEPAAAAAAMPAGELLEQSKADVSAAASSPQSSMADIKPKAAAKDFSFSDSNLDRDFLAPEKFSFDLKADNSGPSADRHDGKSPKWLWTLIYIVVALIIIAVAALIFLNSYSKKLLNQSVVNTLPAANNNNQNNSAMPPSAVSAVPKLALVNAADQVKNLISSAAAKNSQTLQLDTQAVSLPAANVDTLYIKSSNSSQTQAIIGFLKQFGLAPQIQQKSDLTDDYALYLASTLSNLNLGGVTAAVYNSGSTPGVAAKYCTALKKYKVASCNALNAATKQDIFTVATNDPAVIVNLSRTAEFKAASFVPAADKQVEDIRVTTNK